MEKQKKLRDLSNVAPSQMSEEEKRAYRKMVLLTKAVRR